MITDQAIVDSQTVVCVRVFCSMMMSIYCNATQQDGKTALHLASRNGHISVVQVLIGAHVNIHQQDKVCDKWFFVIFFLSLPFFLIMQC